MPLTESQTRYEESLKDYRDIYSVVKTAEDKRALQIAQNLKTMGLPISQITQATGLSEEEIREL